MGSLVMQQSPIWELNLGLQKLVQKTMSAGAINFLLFFSFFFQKFEDIPASRDQFLTNLLELGTTVWSCSARSSRLVSR